MSFITSMPSDDMPREVVLRYATAILVVCAGDGISDVEADAVRAWLSDTGRGLCTFEEALAAANECMDKHGGDPFAGLPPEMLKLYGPYLVRDAVRLAMVDGLSDAEWDVTMTLASRVGVSQARATWIRNAVEADATAKTWWSKVVGV